MNIRHQNPTMTMPIYMFDVKNEWRKRLILIHTSEFVQGNPWKACDVHVSLRRQTLTKGGTALADVKSVLSNIVPSEG